MKLFEKVDLVLSEQNKTLFTTAEIKTLCYEMFGLNKKSVIPSDYCYNRTNNGINENKNILIYVGFGEYKYVGKSHLYEGWVYHRPRGTSKDKIVGQWKEGVYFPLKDTELPIDNAESISDVSTLNKDHIEKLYEDYLSLMEVELSLLNCSPTELRHLIGRIGEFKCALLTNGKLTSTPNKQGFDVISEKNKRISVKTTAQESGFVSININTVNKVDELMVIQFRSDGFSVVYHGDIKVAIEVARIYKNKYELDISKARKLRSCIHY